LFIPYGNELSDLTLASSFVQRGPHDDALSKGNKNKGNPTPEIVVRKEYVAKPADEMICIYYVLKAEDDYPTTQIEGPTQEPIKPTQEPIKSTQEPIKPIQVATSFIAICKYNYISLQLLSAAVAPP